MGNNSIADDLFQEIDTNQDGKIDKEEFRDWISKSKRVPSATYGSVGNGINVYDNNTHNFVRHQYNDSFQNSYKHTDDRYPSDGLRRSMDDIVINTSSPEETEAYLARSTDNIYRDPNPTIISQVLPESAVTQEQRVFVRYLQPPPVPPPGPLIIKEVRDPQPPQPPPLVICERPRPPPSPPPLILREEPPIPPEPIPTETIIRHLPATPVPPRSVIIKRFPPPPERPRDIIIERWLPYGPQPERRLIVQRALPIAYYSRPYRTITTHSSVKIRIVRNFERLIGLQEGPLVHRGHCGRSFLDSSLLVQKARNSDNYDESTPRVLSSSVYGTPCECNVHFNRCNGRFNQYFSSLDVISRTEY